MVRRHEAEAAPEAASGAQQRIATATARILAITFAVLMVSTFVVRRSVSAFDSVGTDSVTTFEAGTVKLSDDDAGSSLIDLSDMAPGRPVSRCIEVTYDGTILPAQLGVAAKADGTLSNYLDIHLEIGSGSGFGECDRFESAATVFDGTLAEFARVSGQRVLPAATLRGRGETHSFRFTFEMQDEQGALGEVAVAEFLWEAAP